MKKDKESIVAFLLETFLFKGMEKEEVSKLIFGMNFSCRTYSVTDLLYSPEDCERRVGFVVRGECTVERRSENEGVVIPLNKIAKGECFGILSVFSPDEEFPTFIRASKECEILFIDAIEFVDLIKKNSAVAMNTIKFMGNRISFLNKKISTFSPNNTRQKVANHLYYLSKQMGESFRMNCKKTSDTLNIGRASLYRSIDSLVADGIINYSVGIIKILDIDKLERISK